MRGGLFALWSYTRRYLRETILGVMLAFLATAMTLATPMAAKWVLDSFDSEIDYMFPAVVLILLLIVGTIAGMMQVLLLGRVAEKVGFDARSSLVQKFFHARLEEIQRFPTGELVARTASDTVLLRAATTSSMIGIISGVISISGSVIFMTLLDVSLMLISLFALLTIGGLFKFLLPKIGEKSVRAQQAVGEFGSILEGGMRALRTIKASQAEEREIARVSARAKESMRYAVQSVWYSALVGIAGSGGVQLATIMILGIGAWRIGNGELAVSTLVAFLMYSLNIIEPVASLGQDFSSLQAGLAAAVRIREIEQIDSEGSELFLAARSALPKADGPILSLRSVAVSYDGSDECVLNDVTFDVPRFGHTALIGPSGAGKTTVFSLFLRFIEPTSGWLELAGVPYWNLTLEDIRSHFSYVEQEAPVIPGSIRDNILLRVDNASDEEAWEVLKLVNLHEMVQSMPAGLESKITDFNISGGEKQRLALARALIHRPSVLLLDEATAQLDGITEAVVQGVIKEAAQSGAVITIAHRLSTVIEADQIVLLDKGYIRDVGKHEDLLGRDNLYRELIAALRIS